MAKRKESGIDLLASLPWPVGGVLGLIGFVVIQYGIACWWGSSDNQILSAIAKGAGTGMYAPFAWFTLFACSIASLVSFLKRRWRRKLLESQTGIESLRSMDWRAFESLVGEAFRRQGYAVEETGQGGADGGKDLVLRKNGLKTIVQCKQWRTQRVPVNVVREMYGVLVSDGVRAVKIVTLCGYTPDAATFARGKPIELIDGPTLLSTVMAIQSRKEPEGALDNPLLFAGSVLACVLVAFVLPSQRPPRPAAEATSPTPTTFNTRPSLTAMHAAPSAQSATAAADTRVTASARKVYKADAPLSSDELRDWEKRNRESMNILEKTTPELETPPPH